MTALSFARANEGGGNVPDDDVTAAAAIRFDTTDRRLTSDDFVDDGTDGSVSLSLAVE